MLSRVSFARVCDGPACAGPLHFGRQHPVDVGRRRIQVAALPVVARTLSVSLEELFGEGSKPATRSKRGPAPKWQQRIEAISKLPKARQRFVSEMLDTVLAQH